MSFVLIEDSFKSTLTVGLSEMPKDTVAIKVSRPVMMMKMPTPITFLMLKQIWN
ncbi:hypothetical protein [Siphonobacter curvatus]|uniref:hypothetical protein n=1 Tax=Siphonobacter curvatus TaxID=2094562 RepID=UPI0013FD5E65|nr:hypothetical protein [Siphonobacter curvatus]